MTWIRRRWAWVLAGLLIVAGLARVRLDTEVLNLLPESVPAVRGLQLYQTHFANSRELILTIRAPGADSAEAAARLLGEALRRETNLVDRVVWQPPWIEHPEQMADFIAWLWLNQPPERVAQLTNRLAPDRLAAVALEARDRLATSLSPTEIAWLSYDPFGLTQLPGAAGVGVLSDNRQEGFASAEGAFRVLYLDAISEFRDYRDCARWLSAVQEAVTRVMQSPDWPPGVVVRYTGSPAFVAEISTRMASDMRLTVLVTLAVIAALFWWAHRSWRPLCWLVAALLLVMAGALAACGFVFGTLNTVSLGFGAILAGLAVDYGLVIYQEATAGPNLTLSALRRLLLPSLIWAALTTAIAFLMLNFAGLPGLSQLGTLVGAGVLLTPLVMLFVFLPMVSRGLKNRSREGAVPQPGFQMTPSSGEKSGLAPRAVGNLAICRVATVLAAGVALVVLWRTGVRVDRGNGALEPRGISANAALHELRDELSRYGEPLLVVISGNNESEVARSLGALETHLGRALADGAQFSLSLPTALWPNPDWQRTNKAAVLELVKRTQALRAAANEAGFTPEAMALTERLLGVWGNSASALGDGWPTNECCRWLLDRATARVDGKWLAVGALYPKSESPALLAARVDPHLPGVWLTGWSLLGESLVEHVERRVLWVALAIVMVVALFLWLAFRRWAEVLIGLGALGFALLVLQAVMSAAGIAWNLMSLAAVPLLLGAGVDYGIHVQMALRRHRGDLAAMRRITGRALLLCAATTAAGFGSNALSSNPGLASLGLVCTLGIAAAYLTAVFLVPAWWTLFSPASRPAPNDPDCLARPSATYGPEVWRLGFVAVRLLPRPVCRVLGRLGASAYRWLRPERLRVIEENLLPVLDGDMHAARRAARRLLSNFSSKITDLLRHESGASASISLSHWSGYEIFLAALERRQGVLLVTPHLGNWEIGGCLLAQRGVRLLVLTQAEPGRGFTELRQQARARWGVETLVIGQDAFAFVEVIKRLQDGAVVALLVDRPPPSTAVTVEFFGRPFQASIAPAELARASGCALVPVYVVADGDAYAAHVLPEILYDRRAIGDREARRRLAEQALRVFEPVVRQHADQWYHFVPLWGEGAPKTRNREIE
ncbi:MAG TPA: MMPL family transporter [Verrucomicrobiota bacterium]|nr:MMPL family transporter [Verrucomicrobiota bacterium]